MPVEEYLVESVTPGQSAYDQIYQAFSEWLERHPGVGRQPELPLYLYYSGLTEATLAVCDAIHNYGCRSAHLMRFDRLLEDYEPLQRQMAACAFQDSTS
jgi:hypothetical protein